MPSLDPSLFARWTFEMIDYNEAYDAMGHSNSFQL